jgi:hypothetical protein
VAGQAEHAVSSDAARELYLRIVAEDPSVRVRTVRGRRPVPVRPALPVPVRRRRMARLALGVSVVTLSAGVAGYALVGHRPTSENVSCYAAADLGADTAVAGAGATDAVAACAAMWARVGFGPAGKLNLRACLLASGAIGVFPEKPGTDVCLTLGLASATPSGGAPMAEADRFVAFRDTVRARLVGQACVGAEPAATIVREELDRAGLGGWTVATAAGEGGIEFSAERPCTVLDLRPEERTVALVPSPKG